MNEKDKKFYITTPIYYVNDKPHIGHAYTTIIADVLARYYREKLGKENVYFLTGTDEHGAKIAESAEKLGVDPQIFVDNVSDEFKTAWKNLKINNDGFIRTSSEKHKEIVSEILKQLKLAKTLLSNDVLYESEYEGKYCICCEKFLNESELVDGKCLHHNQEPKLVKEKNWFFNLQDFLPVIREKIEKDELLIYPEARKNEVLGLINKQNLPDFSISRSVESVPWGIDLPWDENQKAYVWVDALSNYISALDYKDGKLFQKFWPADVQLMALEILKFHAIYWPAILLALGLELPKKLAIHGFFTIDGKKMSKTLGNVIDPNFIVEKYGAEVSRYLILSQFSFGSESDIKVEDFPVKYNADLVNGLGNLINRVTNMVENYLDGKINKEEFVIIEEFIDKVNLEIEKINFKEALNKIWVLIQKSNSLIDQEKPWELAKNKDEANEAKLKVILNSCINNLYNIAIALKSFMPEKSQEILDILNADKIQKPSEPLFPRL